ncbi:prephenate dehydrogenase [Sphaerisporangium melleum]|uniref:Prephenate dehydrogenase n=1 Tax=Sphaerisporangium melleum TaxID=321316 RepID=A0A917RJS0_9ACTN|nr:prephenate dehydrogenase [Sphaerisporangium melleum]GGL10530.1 prephenate dehydrogenase [Sphaerisporangium melleum]GII70726.1 prephenate dehydrogenase [Sphaerisporangium melleum]
MSTRPRGIGRVLVVGTGLIGTSVALALREHGVTVRLADQNAGSVRVACELGAGAEWVPGEGRVDLAVIAVPPQFVAEWLLDLQKTDAARFYTDVASVKALPIEQAARLGCDMSAYVAGHPLAGRERSGPGAARADVFLGRPWAYCPVPETSSEAVATVLELIELCGGKPVEVDPVAHDEAVALISHAPHVAASAVAARLVGASDTALGLAGPGVRDVTRVAGSDPDLWTVILAGNARPVAQVLEDIAADLAAAAAALRAVSVDDGGAIDRVTEMLRRGNAGRRRIPGKHGGPAPAYAVVQVLVGDRPGELARLFQVARDAGVNIEDVRLEHAPGLQLGAAELSVQPESAEVLAEALRAHGWHVPRA